MFTPKAGRLPPRRAGSRTGTPMSAPRRGTSLLNTSPNTSRAGASTPVSRSQVVEATGSHVAQTWGASLPVLVTEVLTRSSEGGLGEVTVSLGASGWAWLVAGRRLVVWRYTAGGARAQCRELSLPPSDLSHKAELCLVYSAKDGSTPCCIAVSPEGVVRYWPSIAQEGSSTEISAELGGQECTSLTALHPVGCLLATTTATLVLIQHSGQTVACRRLAAPTGLLGGLGRRVSSLLWGQAQHTGGEGRLVRAAAPHTPEEPGGLYVLTSNGLQKWQLGEEGEDRLYYECDVAMLAREAVWASQARAEGSAAWLRIWLMDLSVGEGVAAVMVAAIDQNSSSPVLQYGVVTLRTPGPAPPLVITSYTPLPGLAAVLPEGGEPRQHKVTVIGDWAYVYNKEGVTMAGLQEPGEQERIASHIMGAGRTDAAPLFFSSQHGVVSLGQAAAATAMEQSTEVAADTTTRLSESLNCSVSAKGIEDLTMSDSLTDQLKAAFLQFCKKSHAQAQAIVEELFPAGDSADSLDSTLDRLVIGLSKDLVDDFPASDPRWVESVPGGASSLATGASMSLLVLHQLEDKLSCHQFYISFLKHVGLWDRLGSVTMRGRAMATAHLLAEHAEKTVAAVTLRTLHSEHQAIVDQAIRMCLVEREVTASGSLTDQDHFYREISRVDEVLPALLACFRFSVRSDSPRQLVATATSVNTVVLAVLRECLEARNRRAAELEAAGRPEFLPWTATRRHQLQELAKLGVEQGVPACEEAAQRNRLYQQVVALGDLVLDSYTSQLASLDKGAEEASLRQAFIRDRGVIIGLLADRKVWEEAASLAEKYRDFDTLVKMCEETGNQEKLEGYMERFAGEEFSKHVYAWYVKEGRQARLLSLGLKGQERPELTAFLSHHHSLSWLHDIHTGNHAAAAATLTQLAAQEVEVAARRKTQLSLAKLAALASKGPEEEVGRQLGVVEQEMALVAAQEQLPTSVLRQFGFDRETMRVLTAREMIELYIGDENLEADYVDFKKALDLLGFAVMEEEERRATWLHIWSRSILRNTWTDIDVDNPLESVRDTVFFRLVEFAFMQGADLAEFLPRPEALLDSLELGELRESANFRYLIQTGYEQIQRVCAN